MCTFLNSMSLSVCDICASARPTMEQIMAEFMAKKNEDKGGKDGEAIGDQ